MTNLIMSSEGEFISLGGMGVIFKVFGAQTGGDFLLLSIRLILVS
jgi:hypothetical protein